MNNLAINISNAPAKSATSQPAGKDDIAQQDGQNFGNVLTRQVADSDKSAESTPATDGEANKQAASPSAKQADDKDSADSAPATPANDSAIAASLPADMLVALLAQQTPQQNLATTPQPNTGLQPALDTQTASSIASTSSMATATTGAAELKAATTGAAELKAATAGAAELKAATAGAAEIKAATAGAAEIKVAVPTALPMGNIKPADTALSGLDKIRPQTEGAVKVSAKNSKDFAESMKASADTKEAAAGNHLLRGNAIGELTTTTTQHIIAAPTPGVATPSTPLSINTPVTQPAWGDEFAQKITWISTQRNQSAELHLNPPQLGPLDVVIKVNGDQATAMFTSAHAAVRDAIEQALPKLREMLADNGIMLGNAMVSDQPARNDQNNSSRKSQERTSTSGSATEVASIQETRGSRASRHNGMVDTFA